MIEENGATADGTIDDVAVNCLVGITYGDDGETATAITVYERSEGGTPRGGGFQNGGASQAGGASEGGSVSSGSGSQTARS